MTDASDMLAAALEQMDGIIAGNARGAARPALSSPSPAPSLLLGHPHPAFPLCPASPTLPVNSDILQQNVKISPSTPRLLIKLRGLSPRLSDTGGPWTTLHECVLSCRFVAELFLEGSIQAAGDLAPH